MSEVNAVPGLMTDFLHLPVPDLAPLRRTTQAAGCTPAVVTCPQLVAADAGATVKLHEFLTHMAQGITAYRDIVSKCAQTYADGAAYSEATIKAVCTYDSRQMLPDVAPGLTTPVTP
jgi:hypothetical protein